MPFVRDALLLAESALESADEEFFKCYDAPGDGQRCEECYGCLRDAALRAVREALAHGTKA